MRIQGQTMGGNLWDKWGLPLALGNAPEVSKGQQEVQGLSKGQQVVRGLSKG